MSELQLTTLSIFDHVNNEFLDKCGFDSNAFFPTNEEGGVAKWSISCFAQLKTEAEIDMVL